LRDIYILTNTLKSGGAEKKSIYLTNALKHHYKVTLIVYYGDQTDPRMVALLEENAYRVLKLKGNHFSKLLQLYGLFSHEKNAVIISYLFTTNVINAVIGKIAGVKIRIGGMRSSQYSPGKFFFQKLICNHFLTCSIFNNARGLEKLTSRGFSPEKSILIHNAIVFKNDPVYREQKDPVNILSVGRFIEAKDYFTSFDAVAELIHEKNLSNDIRYLVIGHGELEDELKSYVRQKGLEDHVEFVINPPSVDPYYRKADIFLSTSIFEGLCNTIMEAMEASLPVVATNVGDNDKLVTDGRTGFLTLVKDVPAISEKLFALYDNHDLRLQMGTNGYHHLKENFSLETFREKYMTLIERLSNEAKA